MDVFEVGDPYVEWEEENSAKEEYEMDLEEANNIVAGNHGFPGLSYARREDSEYIKEGKAQMQELKEAVVNKLVTEYDYNLEDAEETVDESVSTEPSLWDEKSDPEELAKFLALDDDSE